MSVTMRFGVALVVAVAMSGCTGEPNARSSSSESTTAAAPSSLDIPPVAQPLDVSAFVSDPCALLDVSQRRELGLPAAGKGEDSGGGTCDLHVDPERKDSSNYLRIVVFPDGGLADQYAQCGTLDCTQWTSDSVDGYPVIRATDEMISKHGSCKIFLGVADDAVVTFIDVGIDSGGEGPVCARADRAASMTLATLR